MKKIVFVLLAMVMLIAVPCLAFDGFKGHEGQIPYCQDKTKGKLRIAPVKDVDPTSNVDIEPVCKTTETLIWVNPTGTQGPPGHSPVLTWSGDQIAIDGAVTGPHLTGPKGATGATGARGATGATGAQGPPGVANGIRKAIAGVFNSPFQADSGAHWVAYRVVEYRTWVEYDVALTSMTDGPIPICVATLTDTSNHIVIISARTTWEPARNSWAFVVAAGYGPGSDTGLSQYTGFFFICVQE